MKGQKTLIIGGVAGGASCAAHLRRLDERATIILFEKGPYVSYANCGLPYYVGGEIADVDDLLLQTPESLKARFNFTAKITSEVLRIDRARKCIEVLDSFTGMTYDESYDNLVLATGSKLFTPDIKGLRQQGSFSIGIVNNAVAAREYIESNACRSAVVIGGGYIGLEMTETLLARGLEVTLLEAGGQLMGPLDADMALLVQKRLRKKGVKVRCGVTIEEVTRDERLRLHLAGGETVETDVIIFATGITPRSELAKECGLEIGASGGVVVDDHMRTSDPSIYAVGDVAEIRHLVTGAAGRVPLAGPANRQGVIAADNIAGVDSVYHGAQGSSIVRVIDTVAAVTGATEKALTAAGIPYEKCYLYPWSNASYYPGAQTMLIKLLFAPADGRVLGAQLLGCKGVDKRADQFALAVRGGLTVWELRDLELCYSPPFASAKDPVNMAGYIAANMLSGREKMFYPQDVERLVREGVYLLDVRTPGEYSRGTIAQAVNIPLDALRSLMHRLPRTEPIYLFCAVGVRGHTAARLLTEHGFDVYNLSGGYNLWAQLCL